ncbi:Acetyltransferase (GNAT) domain protein [Tepidimonas thermarum]|uniref:Acetyltransferase (GNAT) domain protein n=1 Tax=Tepidimonas thermarum TaxID=335431 RepID=A0A554X4I6_9BURK|nr:GNAT family N-acetyltransferase [Tepidimonas thermarum]TSE30749.1 Acetyltransferase (GNAT) domain protein [Tepidimonas thermarum]
MIAPAASPSTVAPPRGARVPVRDLPAATEPGPARRRARAPIRTLDASHRDAILRHLLALGERDRYLRFGYAAQDEHIRRYVEGLRFGLDEVFGIFNRRLELIAMAHLAYLVSPERGSDSAEFGVSVSAHARGRGYGHQLFARALAHARNHGVRYLYIHALSENGPMLRIARSAGATVVQHAGESECHLEVPPADFESHLSEFWEEEVARTDYWIKALRRWGRRLLDLLRWRR